MLSDCWTYVELVALYGIVEFVTMLSIVVIMGVSVDVRAMASCTDLFAHDGKLSSSGYTIIPHLK